MFPKLTKKPGKFSRIYYFTHLSLHSPQRIFLGQHCTRKLSKQRWPMANRELWWEKNNLYNVVSTLLGQHYIGQLSSQCCPDTSETKLHKKISCAILVQSAGKQHIECCLNLPVQTLYKKVTCAMLTHSLWTTFHRKIICNVILIFVGQQCTRKLPLRYWQSTEILDRNTHSWQKTFLSKITCTMLFLSSCYVYQTSKHRILNVVQIHLREHYTRKLLLRCCARPHSHLFVGK